MGNCWKHIFWSKVFLSISCSLSIHNPRNVETWPHLLASCCHGKFPNTAIQQKSTKYSPPPPPQLYHQQRVSPHRPHGQRVGDPLGGVGLGIHVFHKQYLKSRHHAPHPHTPSTLPTPAGVGHQWKKSTRTGCNQWLSLVKITLKVPHAGRNRSVVANTSRCGEGIRRGDLSFGLVHKANPRKKAKRFEDKGALLTIMFAWLGVNIDTYRCAHIVVATN